MISGPGSGAPGSQLTFVVEVQRDGTAASGQTVTFNVNPNDETATLGSTSETTDRDGRAQTILTAWRQCLRFILNHCNEQ